MLSQELVHEIFGYDAVAPDDLGSEWLARAADAGELRAEAELLRVEDAGFLRHAAMSVVSESSLNAADPDQIEADAIARLEQSDDEPSVRSTRLGSSGLIR